MKEVYAVELLESLMENFEVQDLSELGQEQLESAVLEQVLMELPELGEVLVGGNPFEIGERLDDYQGDNFYNFGGDCGLVSVCNILTMADIPATEDEVVGRAIILGQCVYSELNPPSENGATSVFHRQAMLESYGISSVIYPNFSESASLEALARYVEAGHGVNISVNAGYAWDDPNCIGDGTSNHSIVVTGTAWDPDTGELKGLFVCDSGRTDINSKAMFLSAEVLQDAYLDAPGCYALVTTEAIR